MRKYLKSLISLQLMFNTSNITLEQLSEFKRYLSSVPFNVLCSELYTVHDIFDEFRASDPQSFDRCYDTRVYKHVCALGKHSNEPFEMMARSMHDCEMLKHMNLFLEAYDERHVVGIMGGHAMKRDDESYRKTVEVSKRLTEKGYLMISGGGPGAMEATHFGAWMAGRTEEEVDDAIRILSAAPCYKDEGWLATAFEVRRKYPLNTEYKSLAIPTWFYGHEPPCAFATHIAKFFDNSIREDAIVTIAYGGLIYMPGSAGTIQEIFQEAVQDHYLSFGYASPMVFVGTKFWTKEVPVVPFMQTMIEKGHYKNLLLSVVDQIDSIIKCIDDFKSIYDSLPPDSKCH